MKPKDILIIGLVMLATNSIVAMGAEPAPARVTFDNRITHLNVRVRELVNLESFCVAQDGKTWPLFYDRSTTPFDIPAGYSFVVTDIVANPFCIGSPDPNARWFFLLEGPKARRFVVQFRGESTKHYALSGGLAYTSDNVPAIRMIGPGTGLSAGNIDIQILGYFVKGNAIPPDGSRF